MPVSQVTRRELELKAAHDVLQKRERERDSLNEKAQELAVQFDALQARRDQVQSAEEIATVTRDMDAVVEALDTCRRHLEEFCIAHSQVTIAYHRAQLALTREPCEMALLRVDALFRELETAWGEAGRQAQLLRQTQDDDWGTGKLMAIRSSLGSVNPLSWQIHALELPHVADMP